MAVRFDANADFFSRTSDVLSYATFTLMAWFRLVVDNNDFGHFLAISNTGETQYDHIGVDSDGTTLRSEVGGGTAVTGSALTVGTWYHIALVRESTTSLKTYLNSTLDITSTDNVAGRAAPNYMRCGSFFGLGINARAAGLKGWSSALTAAEIQQETQILRPSRSADLYGFWPVFPGATERLADYSGNGRGWTANGTLTDEDPPPVSWGASPILVPFAAAAAAGPDILRPWDRTMPFVFQ